MNHVTDPQRRHRALVRGAIRLLALCLFVVGTLPAMAAAAEGAAAVDPAGVPVMVIDHPGHYTLDHDHSCSSAIGVLINSSDVVLDGAGHRVAGTGQNGSVGILVSGPGTVDGEIASNVTVRNLVVSGWETGVRIGVARVTLVEHVVAEQNANGLVVNGYTGSAGGDHLVRDSVFRNNAGTGVFQGNGILLSYPADGITIERCTVTGNGVGITTDEISHGGPNSLVDSELSGNAGDGLTSRDSGFGVVRNCTVSQNGDDGLKFEHGGAEIVGCHIERNAHAGIRASDRGGCDIHGNWIQSNGAGILAGGDWPSHVRNNYLNNTDNGFFGSPYDRNYLNYEKAAGQNIVGGPYLGGNFWANPSGTGFSQTHADADRDGICDEPYHITEDATDYLPLAPAPGTPVITPTPYKEHAVPGRVEGEDYDLGGENVAYHDTTPGNSGDAYRQDSVDIEAGGSRYDVGWIRTGEWLQYTLTVSRAGFYSMTARAASPNAGRQVTVSVNSNPMYYINVPNTGSFGTYATTPDEVVYLPAGNVTLRLTFTGDGQNLDWFELAPQSDGTPAPTPPSTPYKPLAIPGTIQAEDYDLGGEGVAYHDTTAGNSGGAYRQDRVDIETAGARTNVGWIRSGEWLTYTATVQSAGTYTMTANVASPNPGRTIAVSVDGNSAGMIAVPNTGSFSTFRTGSVPVTLGTGTHTIRLTFTGDGQNVDWIAFGTGTTPPTTTTPVPSGGASFSAVPTTGPHGSAVKFTVTPASGKSISAAWWSFDAAAHLSTWNSRTVNPTFYYPVAGTFSPLVKISYTDGSTETVQRNGYIRAT